MVITYPLGAAGWKVLNVDNSKKSETEDLNDTSIVIELMYGNKKYLFMGDASSKVENSKTCEKVDVLKYQLKLNFSKMNRLP